MPTYTYTAKSAPNKIIQGEIEAESEQDAIHKLSGMQLFPVSVTPTTLALASKKTFGFKKVSSKDLVLFTRQLSSLIDSGINIVNALNILTKQTDNRYLKELLKDVIDKIRNGSSLSESLSTHRNTFSDLYTSILHTGESSGKLNSALKELSDFLEEQDEFRNSLRASLTYPLFVLCVGIATVIVLLVFVIPRLVSMFEDMGQALPLPTQLLISTSAFIRGYWWLIIIMVSLLIFVYQRLYRSPQGRLSVDRFKLKMTLFGPIILKTEIGRLSRTLSLLLGSGIPITSALDISATVLDNQVLKEEMKKIKSKIADGATLYTCFRDSGLFPEFVTNITAIGEETGSLDKSLLRIANEYEKDTQRTIKALTRLLEPVIILVMGIVVGFIVLSMLLPIFQINLIVK
ncbi:MAG: type II secretion system F family protein [Candidatus Omnitrophota bacterium]